MEGLNIFQWNANGLTSHGHELKTKFKLNKGPHIACIQETKFSKKSKFTLPNYNSVRTDRAKPKTRRAAGGLIIFIREDINYEEIKIDTPNLEANGIKITLNNRNINIINIYHWAEQKVQPEDLNKLLQISDTSTIFLGDFNAHHPTWSIDDKIDNHGKLISEWIETNDLVLLNSNQPTRYDKINQKMSAIDLTICTADLAQSTQWEVHDVPLGSDHFPINITIGNTNVPIQTENQEPKFLYNEANWDQFQDICNEAN